MRPKVNTQPLKLFHHTDSQVRTRRQNSAERNDIRKIKPSKLQPAGHFRQVKMDFLKKLIPRQPKK